MAYKFSSAQSANIRSKVRKYNAAITKATREYKKLYEGEYLEDALLALPSKITTKQVKAQIDNINDYRRIVGYPADIKRGRYSKLDRITRPGALDLVDTEHTQYEKKEVSLAAKSGKAYKTREMLGVGERKSKRFVRQVERIQAQREYDYEYGLTPDPSPEDAISYANSDGYFVPGEVDDSYIDVSADTLQDWNSVDFTNYEISSEVSKKLESYLKAWEDAASINISKVASDMVNKLVELRENAPDLLEEMFNEYPDELIPDFIYLSPTTGGYASIRYETRIARSTNYINTYYDQYKGR